MAPAESQRIPMAERRERLLRAAAELFAESGYHGTDMAAIAAATGVTKVIVYRAFGSKLELYEALLDRHRDELLGILAEPWEGHDPDLDAQTRAALDRWFSYVEEHPFAWRLLFRDVTGLPELEERHRVMRAQARHVLAEVLVEHAGVAPSEAEEVAEFLRAAIIGLATWWLEHPDRPRKEIVGLAHRLGAGALAGVRPT
jgi:AcrR family transcriptional regulator